MNPKTELKGNKFINIIGCYILILIISIGLYKDGYVKNSLFFMISPIVFIIILIIYVSKNKKGGKKTNGKNFS